MIKTSQKATDGAAVAEATTKLAMATPVEMTVQTMAAAGAVSAATFGYWYGLWTGVARKVGLTGMGAGNFGLATMWNAPSLNASKGKPAKAPEGLVLAFKAPEAKVAEVKAPEVKAPETKAPEAKVAAPKAAEPKATKAKAVEEPVKPAVVAEAASIETPVVAVSVAETPVVEAPVAETPVVEAPVVEALAAPVVSEPVAEVAAAPVVDGTVAPVAAEAPVAMSRPAGLAAAREGGADDLKMISGVGPKIEMVLNDLGIFHFSQIAGWSAAEVAWVDDYLKFRGRITRDNWIAQADALATGGREEYTKRFGKEPR